MNTRSKTAPAKATTAKAAPRKAAATKTTKATTTKASTTTTKSTKSATATTKRTTKAKVALATKTNEPEQSETEEETAAASPKPTRRKKVVEDLPPFNPLPTLPAHTRPPLQLFIFGNGDSGQFGLGTDAAMMGEFARPRLHTWFDEAIKEGKLGEEGAGVESVAAGGMHTLVIDEAGKVWSWGVNDEGSLGRPVIDVPNPEKPEEMMDREELECNPMVIDTLVEEDFRAAAVSAGDNISVMLSEDGTVWACGSFRADEGSLGFSAGPNGTRVQVTPTALTFERSTRISSIAAGDNHAIALTTDGRVYAWGADQQGQLGRRVPVRRKLNGTTPERLRLRRIELIGTGASHSFAVRNDGKVYGWGLNSMGQLGLGDQRVKDQIDGVVWAPTVIKALLPEELGGATVKQIAGGEHHTLFLLSDGRVFGCGRVDSSQLGLGPDHPAMSTPTAKEDGYIATPTLISFPPPPAADEPAPPIPPLPAPLNPMKYISTSGRFSLAVSESGHVYSWGYGASCQLGLGADTEEAPVPERVRWKNSDHWIVERAEAGGQHCILLVRKKEVLTNGA
ncbi:hypothetical protein BOTBODRAFT_110732 [Botryobasidium botryosum FD-172 SS1]|uniref:RCC1-like domain-containing protein n=1 Tax=Botryobasidium botryosum (strain FD-172 SS1) TaxID=930990 RepID=A0A067MGY3_BOTB1|nr:hypothetical protein BOTBODRAFT_110732 [Botryobasidium botryosum FD-172 SS1]